MQMSVLSFSIFRWIALVLVFVVSVQAASRPRTVPSMPYATQIAKSYKEVRYRLEHQISRIVSFTSHSPRDDMLLARSLEDTIFISASSVHNQNHHAEQRDRLN